MKTLNIAKAPTHTFGSFTELFRQTADLMSSLHYSSDSYEKEHKKTLLSAIQNADRILKSYFLLLQKVPGKRKITQEHVVESFNYAAKTWNDMPANIKDSVESIYAPETYVESVKKLLSSAETISAVAKTAPIKLHEITEED